jgi:hypothetical protein
MLYQLLLAFSELIYCEVKRIEVEVVIVSFKVLPWNFLGGTEKP